MLGRDARHRGDRHGHEDQTDTHTEQQQPRQQVRGEPGIDGCGRQPERTTGGQQQPTGSDQPGRDVAQQMTPEPRSDDQDRRHGQESQSGLQRGVAEHRLEEDRTEEDRPDQQPGHPEHHTRPGDQGLDPPGVRRHQRMRHPPLDEPERHQQQPRDDQDGKGFRGCPAVAGRALDAEHERSQAGDSGDGAGQVQLAEPGPGRTVAFPAARVRR